MAQRKESPKPQRSQESTESHEKLLRTATQAAKRAGDVLMRHFEERLFEIRKKPGAGLVTNADIEAEKMAIKTLLEATPDFSILAEEDTHSGSDPNARGQWIIDPLDGTTNFVHGFPMFCVSIGAKVGNDLVVGVVYHPVINQLFTAVKGQGAYCNQSTMKVSTTSEIENAVLTTGFAYQTDPEKLRIEIENFEHVSRRARAVRRPGSAALDLAFTAKGVFDGYWERNLNPWDVAAGIVLVLEAGGTISNYRNQSITAGNGPSQSDSSQSSFNVHKLGAEILASNSKLHESLVRLLAPKA